MTGRVISEALRDGPAIASIAVDHVDRRPSRALMAVTR